MLAVPTRSEESRLPRNGSTDRPLRRGIVGALLLVPVMHSPANAAAEKGASDRIGVSAKVIRPAEIVSYVAPQGVIMVRVSNSDQARISSTGAVAGMADDSLRLAPARSTRQITVTVEY